MKFFLYTYDSVENRLIAANTKHFPQVLSYI